MDILKEFLTGDLILLTTALCGLGVMLKKTNKLDDAWIPFVLLPIGIVFSSMLNGLCATSVLQGIIAVMASVYSNNLLKQSSELINKTENK